MGLVSELGESDGAQQLIQSKREGERVLLTLCRVCNEDGWRY